MGNGIYKHMWLFKGGVSEEDIEVGIAQLVKQAIKFFLEIFSKNFFQTRVTLEGALLFTSASLFCTDTSFLLHCFMLPRRCGAKISKTDSKHFFRNEVEGTMLEERFGLGEWEEGGVGGADAENCTFW